MQKWCMPIDMDVRENKITYQKCRLFIVIPFVVIDIIYLGIADTFFLGPSMFLKKQKSALFFLTLVGVIVFRQKYEL